MPIPPIDGVKSILEDFELRMREILESAWDEWLEMPKRGVLSARSRASVVFDFICKLALAEFDGDPNIRAIPKARRSISSFEIAVWCGSRRPIQQVSAQMSKHKPSSSLSILR